MSVFNVVPQKVARNPVARAVQKAVLAKAIRDFQTRIFLLEDGEECRVDIDVAWPVICFAWALKNRAGAGGTPASDVLWGAMAALKEMEGRWVKSAAELVDDALTLAMAVSDRATADQATQAWKAVVEVQGGDA